MNWIAAHHFGIGLLADGLTFLGGALLARDAFLRLRELNDQRIHKKFRQQNPNLNLTDDELAAAIVAMRWTLSGFVLLLLGFACQLLLRFAE